MATEQQTNSQSISQNDNATESSASSRLLLLAAV